MASNITYVGLTKPLSRVLKETNYRALVMTLQHHLSTGLLNKGGEKIIIKYSKAARL